MGQQRDAAEQWLKEQGIVAELDDTQYRLVKELIGSPSFGIFYGMLLYRRAMSAIALSNASLSSPERIAAASVLQGQIRAIDDLKEMVLQIAEPQTADAAEPNKEQN